MVELASRSGRRICVGLDEVGSFHGIPESSVVVDGERIEVLMAGSQGAKLESAVWTRYRRAVEREKTAT